MVYYVLIVEDKSGLVIKDVDGVIETSCNLPEKYKSKGSKIHIQILTIRLRYNIQIKGFRLHYKMSDHALQRYTTHTTTDGKMFSSGMLVKSNIYLNKEGIVASIRKNV
jgi:hypothetical protein